MQHKAGAIKIILNPHTKGKSVNASMIWCIHEKRNEYNSNTVNVPVIIYIVEYKHSDILYAI